MNKNYMNPLDIPYILETIFDHLSVWNLKKCRLISHLWYEEATPHLLKRCKISFKSPEQFIQLESLSNLPLFCQTFDISHEVDLECESVHKFFHKFSSSIKSLDLSYHHEYSTAWAVKIFPYLTSLEELCLNGRAGFLHESSLFLGDELNFPNLWSKLKFLFIYDSSYELESRHRQRIWIENIFQLLLASQNSLERLFFAPFLEQRARTFFNLITSDALIHHQTKISHLHINHLSVTPPEIKVLLGKKFPLKYVHLVLNHNLSRDDLNSFLFQIQATLRELTLTFTDGVSSAQFHPIQPLDNLTKLSLIGYEGCLMTSSAKNLQLFVMSLPEPLPEMMNDDDCCSACSCSVVKGLQLTERLRDLEIYDSKGKYVPNTLKWIYSHFYALKSLKMNNIDNSILRLVYEYLPTLIELHICFHKFYGVSSLNLDAGLSGIPEFRLEEELLDCIDFKDIDHLRTYPWIGGMKCLRVLELELGSITDFGIVLGIVQCSTIMKLGLKNCDRVFDDKGMMTDLSLIAISDAMQNLTYLKMEGYNDCFTDEGLNLVKKKMEGIETYFL